MEEWRDIKGYEGLYQVSSEGRVKSLERYVQVNGGIRLQKGFILKPYMEKNGYTRVLLYKDGIRKKKSVHRIVAETFIGECPEGYEVDHINTLKDDNRAENLRYCTPKENMNNPLTIKKIRCNIETIAIKRSKPVLQLTLDGIIVREWSSATEAAKQTGFNQGNINNCCNGGFYSKQRGKWVNYFQYKGYKWQYKND